MIITRELVFFLWFAIGGMVAGMFFDVFRVTRHNRRMGHLVVYLEDMIFWIALGGFFLWLANKLDVGSIRFYMFAGMGLGGTLYFLTISRFIYKVLDLLCRYLIRTIVFVKGFFRRLINEKKSESA